MGRSDFCTQLRIFLVLILKNSWDHDIFLFKHNLYLSSRSSIYRLLSDISLVGLRSDQYIFVVKVLQLILQVGSICSLSFGIFVYSWYLGHGQDGKVFKLLNIGWALLIIHKLNAESSSSMSEQPGCLLIFGLHLHILTQVHIMYSSMQGTSRLVNFIYIYKFLHTLPRV